MAFHFLSISPLIYGKQGPKQGDPHGCSPVGKPCGTMQGPGPIWHCQVLGTTSNLCQKNATGETQQLFQAPNGAVTQEGQALSHTWHRRSKALIPHWYSQPEKPLEGEGTALLTLHHFTLLALPQRGKANQAHLESGVTGAGHVKTSPDYFYMVFHNDSRFLQCFYQPFLTDKLFFCSGISGWNTHRIKTKEFWL